VSKKLQPLDWEASQIFKVVITRAKLLVAAAVVTRREEPSLEEVVSSLRKVVLRICSGG